MRGVTLKQLQELLGHASLAMTMRYATSHPSTFARRRPEGLAGSQPASVSAQEPVETLSRKFIDLHGGRIWVQSEVGSGSTFTFTIPAAAGRLS